MPHPRLLALLALPWVGLAAGCGGSGSSSPDVLTLTATLGAEGALEGTRDGPGNIVEVTGGLDVGDREGQAAPPDKGPVKSFLSFDLSTIPSNATVLSAELRLNLVTVVGSPIAQLGVLHADLVDYGAAFPGVSSWTGNTVLGNLAIVAADATPGLKTCSVLFGVNFTRAQNRTRMQLRLEFTNQDQSFDSSDTRLEFEDAENSLGSSAVPLLVVRYEVPN